MIFYELEKRNIYVCPGPHHDFHFDGKEKEVLLRTFEIKSFVLQHVFVFVESGCVQHADARNLGRHNLRYYEYSASNNITLPDAI